MTLLEHLLFWVAVVGAGCSLTVIIIVLTALCDRWVN